METYIEYRIKTIITAIVFTVSMENWRTSYRAHMKTQFTELMLHTYYSENSCHRWTFEQRKSVKDEKKKVKMVSRTMQLHIFMLDFKLFSLEIECVYVSSRFIRLNLHKLFKKNCFSFLLKFEYFAKPTNLIRCERRNSIVNLNTHTHTPHTLAVLWEYIRKYKKIYEVGRLAKMYCFDEKAPVWWNMQEW